MIPVAVALATAGGLLLSTLRQAWWRVVGLVLLLGACAASLASILSPGAAVLVVPPVVAALYAGRTRRPRLDFDPLIRRTAIIALLLAAALVGSLKLLLGDVPWPEFTAFWMLAALGLAWVVEPQDALERDLGATLLLAGGSGILLVLFPAGPVSAGIAGLLAAVPTGVGWLAASALGREMPAGKVSQPLLIFAAAAAIAGAATGLGFGRAALADLGFSVDGVAATGTAMILLAAAAFHGASLAAVTGILSLVTTVPAVRWAALGVVVAASRIAQVRRAWAGLVVIGLSAALGGLVAAPLGTHWQAVLLALAWLVFLTVPLQTAEGRILMVVTTFLVLSQLRLFSAPIVERFQFAAVASALLLVLGSVLPVLTRRGASLRHGVGMALLMTATATSLPVGDLAAVLLAIDVAIIRPALQEPAPAGSMGALLRLAGSGWPPAITFAARVLALVAAVQTSLLLTVVAVGLLVLGPLVAMGDAPPVTRRTDSGIRLTPQAGLAIVLSLALGFAPSLLAGMLRLS